jgi:multidrug efflux pump subunit AcrB
MKNLIILFIRRPITVIMILAAIIIFAVFSVFKLSVNRLPEISVPYVTVETFYPGMAANEIRTLVTIPLEDGLSSTKGLEKIQSVTRDNRSLIKLFFRWGIDPMAASVLVREAVDTVYPALPEGARKPVVTSGDSENEPHAIIAVSSPNGNEEMSRKLAEYELRSRLRKIDGIGQIILVGGDVLEEKLTIDVQSLSALGISPSNFTDLLAREAADIPAGNARDGNMEIVIVGSGKPDSMEALSEMILPLGKGTVRVQDTGKMNLTSRKKESIFVFDGKEAVALEIYRRAGKDPVRLSSEIKKTIAEAEILFSRDVKIEIISDSTPALIKGITGLLFSSALGAAAVVVAILFFIRRLRCSLLAALSIPFSAAIGIITLVLTGKSLNSMSLGGLAMAIGMVSDTGVIVLDLLHRSFEKRTAVPDTEEIGDKAYSIAGSSIASTLTTTLVFFPVIMLPGPLGGIFGDLAIALTASVFAGWFYAQFFLPSLYRYTFGEEFQIKIKSFNFDKIYHKYLLKSLRYPKKILLTAAFLSITGVILLIFRPVVFINPDEAEDILVSLNFQPGTLLEYAVAKGREVSNDLSKSYVIEKVYGRAGAEEEDVSHRADINYKKEELILRCVLKKGKRPEKVIPEIEKIMKRYNDIQYSIRFPADKIESLFGLSGTNTYLIRGKDRQELTEHIEILENLFDADTLSFRPSGIKPVLQLYPKREAAAYLSMSASEIAETLYILNEGAVAARLEIEGKPLDVRITGERIHPSQSPEEYIQNIPLLTPQGGIVYLDSLGWIERKYSHAALARQDRSDVIYLDTAPNKKMRAIIANILNKYTWFHGTDESVFNRYKTSIFLYICLVFILLYLTMGAQFESFFLPLVLMLTIPFSLAGAGIILFITNTKMDSGAILGLASLFGLVVNNSLVLFEISSEKINAGIKIPVAVYRGALERFQSIVITTITTILALLPLIVNPLGNTQRSMSLALLGGLIASVILGLFAIPVVLIRFFNTKYSYNGC